jgi:hypothetical protein
MMDFISKNNIPMLSTVVLQGFVAFHTDVYLCFEMMNTSPLLNLLFPSLLMYPLGYKDEDIDLLFVLIPFGVNEVISQINRQF